MPLQPMIEEAQLIETSFFGVERMEMGAAVNSQLLVLGKLRA